MKIGNKARIDENGYLIPHFYYQTDMIGIGWKLCVEFGCMDEDGNFEHTEDPYIKKDQMKDFHSSIKSLIPIFGLVQVGDWVCTNHSSNKVIERTFDVSTKTLTIHLGL